MAEITLLIFNPRVVLVYGLSAMLRSKMSWGEFRSKFENIKKYNQLRYGATYE